MIRPSIPMRESLARLALPVLVLAGVAVLLLGRADASLAERARMAVADALTPAFAAVELPLATGHAVMEELRGLRSLRADNARLRAENEQLLQWQAAAVRLDAENAMLKETLHWVPDPAASYVTARVVADAGGVYARAVLLPIGRSQGVTKGQVALDGQGLVGRVTELGARSARVLLVTDLNSRIPVTLEGSRGHAILLGTTGPRPRLAHWAEDAPPVEGERVVTSAEANAFPAGLPLGTVRYTGGTPEVELAARLGPLDAVRLVDSGPRGPRGARPAAGRGRRCGAGLTPRPASFSRPPARRCCCCWPRRRSTCRARRRRSPPWRWAACFSGR